MRSCSLTRHITIVAGSRGDYEELAGFHYRNNRLGPYVAIFKLLFNNAGVKINAGVIVYTMPSVGLELRNIATGNLFATLDRSMRLALINRNFRCIARVIIEPRFRALGLASYLVRRTLGQLGVPFIEALAVMGSVNPFFEKAGMKAYNAPIPARCAELIEAFSLVGIEEKYLIDPEMVQHKIEALRLVEAGFIERRIKKFLQSYGKQRNMPEGIERTRFILSKLTDPPVYYIWLNENAELKTG